MALTQGLVALSDWESRRWAEKHGWVRRRRPHYEIRWRDGVCYPIRKIW